MQTRNTNNAQSLLRGPLQDHNPSFLSAVMANDEAGSAPEHASVALFTPITSPVLWSADPIDVAKFLKEQGRYEVEVLAKQAEVPTLSMVPYSASIDRTLLRHLVFIVAFDDTAPDTTVESLADENVEVYERGPVPTSQDEVDPAHILEALKSVKFPVKIRDSSALITTYCADEFKRLDAIGYGEFERQNPKHTIKLLLEGFCPQALS